MIDFLDGFEHGSLGSLAAGSNPWEGGYNAKSGAGISITDTGTTQWGLDGYHLSVNGTGISYLEINNRVWRRFAMEIYPIVIAEAAARKCVDIYNDGGTKIASLEAYKENAGSNTILRFTGNTNSVTITVTTYIEVDLDDSTHLKLYYFNTATNTRTLADTITISSSTSISKIQFGWTATATNSTNIYYDNIVAATSTNNICGTKIWGSSGQPNANGTYTGWQANDLSADKYAHINQTPFTTGTYIVPTSTTDQYTAHLINTFGNIIGDNDIVVGMKISAIMWDDSADSQFQFLTYYNSTLFGSDAIDTQYNLQSYYKDSCILGGDIMSLVPTKTQFNDMEIGVGIVDNQNFGYNWYVYDIWCQYGVIPGATSSISKVSGVARASISKVSGVTLATLKKILGVT
jgi:hypothetical protein